MAPNQDGMIPGCAPTPASPGTPAPPRARIGRFAEIFDIQSFHRGNLHAHSSWSDGDAPPEHVYRWYRHRGYAFAAITDHGVRSDPHTFHDLERDDFVILAGEEITMDVQGKPVHVNGLCTERTIGGGRFASSKDALTWAIDRVLEQQGVALVNHPNFYWALTPDDLLAAGRAQLLEIHSGHPGVHSEGNAKHPSEEALWEGALASGKHFAAVAVDDTHHIDPAFPDPAARPGRGWVEVFSGELSARAICADLAKGRFYSSSGARLRRIQMTETSFSVWPRDADTLVEFLDIGGKLLAQAHPSVEAGATYTLAGGEKSVRARFTRPNHKRAWTQSYRVAY
jgi:hypothetical protein